MSLPHDPPSVQQCVDDFNAFSWLQRDLILLLRLVCFNGDIQLTCTNTTPHWDSYSFVKTSRQVAQPAFVVRFSFLGLLWTFQRLQVRCRSPASFGVNLAEPPTWTAERKQLPLVLISIVCAELLGPNVPPQTFSPFWFFSTISTWSPASKLISYLVVLV